MIKIDWQNLPNTTTPINRTNLNQMQTNAENAINVVDEKVEKKKYQDFTVSITPSTDRGGNGYGETNLDISSLNATEILGYNFHTSSTFLIWGVSTNITNNPQQLTIYGYRLNGTYSTAINVQIRVYYKD